MIVTDIRTADLRWRLDSCLAVVLRTPGLFLIDYWWQRPNRSAGVGSAGNPGIFSAVVTNCVLINGFLLLLLPLSYIRSLYLHFVFGSLLLSAHILSYYFVNVVDVDSTDISIFNLISTSIVNTALAKQISLLGIHIIIAITLSCLLLATQKPLLPILACYSLPVLARLADVPQEFLQILHDFCFILVIICLLRYSYKRFPSFFVQIKDAYSNLIQTTELQGTSSVLVKLISKIFVPTHFLLFWLVAFLIKLQETTSTDQEWYVTVLTAASAVCISPVSLLSTAIAVTYLSYFTLSAIKFYLWGHHKPASVHHQQHSGWEEGLTTLLLALLTGLTDMKQNARMAVLTIILFVVLSSLLQSMLEIAEPVILSLSAYHGRNILHHAKVLILCAFLFFFPLHVSWVLAHIFPVDFWMAVVLSTSLLTSAQVLDLIIVHCLLWYDASRKEPLESMDEAVYIVRGFAKIIEFVIASSVVIVGLYEGIIGKWSWINAFILIVHCYFNVWQRFQAGWTSYLRRRGAVKKSLHLTAATAQQLAVHNDVCAICYVEMLSETASIVTDCHHFFHRTCLRKWLCFQDRCPLCSSSIEIVDKRD